MPADIDLTLLGPDALVGASDWVQDLMSVPGSDPRDADGLVLANVGLDSEQLEAWAAKETPGIVGAVLAAHAPRTLPLKDLLKAVAFSASQYAVVVTLKAIQDTDRGAPDA